MDSELRQLAGGLRGRFENVKLSDVGERNLLVEVFAPLVRSVTNAHQWDDCAEVNLNGKGIAVSTDRVPWNLIGRVGGAIDDFGMGRHLAALNLSDLAAAGSRPSSVLANLGFPSDWRVSSVVSVLEGFLTECSAWNAELVGGDLSESAEPQLVATAIGILDGPMYRRSDAEPGDLVFASRNPSVAAAALLAFRTGLMDGGLLSEKERAELAAALAEPRPDFAAAARLRGAGRVSVLDNTDGLGLSLSEVARSSQVDLVLEVDALPIPDVVKRVAELLETDPRQVAVGAGYDFSLVGTCQELPEGFIGLGSAVKGRGLVRVEAAGGVDVQIDGWDYWR